jgi:hypothetical protein
LSIGVDEAAGESVGGVLEERASSSGEAVVSSGRTIMGVGETEWQAVRIKMVRR